MVGTSNLGSWNGQWLEVFSWAIFFADKACGTTGCTSIALDRIAPVLMTIPILVLCHPTCRIRYDRSVACMYCTHAWCHTNIGTYIRPYKHACTTCTYMQKTCMQLHNVTYTSHTCMQLHAHTCTYLGTRAHGYLNFFFHTHTRT